MLFFSFRLLAIATLLMSSQVVFADAPICRNSNASTGSGLCPQIPVTICGRMEERLGLPESILIDGSTYLFQEWYRSEDSETYRYENEFGKSLYTEPFGASLELRFYSNCGDYTIGL